MGEPRKVDESWPTKSEVAARIGKSLAAVTRLTKANKLHPQTVNGVNRYDPDEVALIVATEPATSEDRKEAFAEYQLDTVKAIIGLVREPREKIDELQFAMIDRQQKRIDELEAKLDKQREELEKARDSNMEREAMLESFKVEGQIKQAAAGRMFETIGKLLTGQRGPGGVQLSSDQLEQLIVASKDGDDPFLTPEQVKLAEQSIAQHKAKTAPKEAVQTVTKAVENVAS